MDQSISESDVSISPSQILDRLQVLRQLQILQRGKLQKHRLQYENSPEISSSLTEIVSHFSNSTSYNTFRSLLQSTSDTHEQSPYTNNLCVKENLQNVIEGVSVLNLSDESEFIANSVSSRNSTSPRVNPSTEKCREAIELNLSKKQISLDDMPILSPKKDFETLIVEKLKSEKSVPKVINAVPKSKKNTKRPFLRRGEGMARFGLQKNDLVIQNTKSLPWKRRKSNNNVSNNVSKAKIAKPKNNVVKTKVDKIPIQILEKETQSTDLPSNNYSQPDERVLKVDSCKDKEIEKVTTDIKGNQNTHITTTNSIDLSNNNSSSKSTIESSSTGLQRNKHQRTSKGKTWASVFTKEQDDFLKQLKQSDYYKNFISPVKSTVSEVSCNENTSKISQEREIAEQNLFELIENKVTHESFNINNSFFNRFLNKTNMECSGESTPLVMQKCLYKNPNLMHIQPLASRKRNDTTCSDVETCNSECTECGENCSTVSSCSCQTTQGNISVTCIEEENDRNKKSGATKGQIKLAKENVNEKDKSHNDTLTAENEMIKSNMAEMNAKLIATSELLKDRLRELEDEIETFRKENVNLTKMREEVDMERQKLYEEKNAFEQKFNEEKILSEYHLAEEKEKLNKQKLMYERYVKEMRGRLSKKEKDEVIFLKKEIQDLKEEIKLKDAKSTSIIARLRNQLKIMEKDKKNLEDEVEKLKKENRRIQHSNEITRRVSNIKYLEEINKKLSDMTSRDSRTNVESDTNIKYKAFEIEKQSRLRKSQVVPKRKLIQRAKSVPNLHVTSRYAKYFSQKDSISEREKNLTLGCNLDIPFAEDNFSNCSKSPLNNSELSNNNSDSEDNNSLEKIYNERFKSNSPRKLFTKTAQMENLRLSDGSSEYFNENTSRRTSQKSLDKSSTSDMLYNSHSRASKSPALPHSNRSHDSKSPSNFFIENRTHSPPNDIDSHRNKSSISTLSNNSSSSLKSGTVINKVFCERLIPSPEPTSSKSSLSKTNLNPTEIKKPDGTRELRFPNGNVKILSADGKYSKFIYYNGDIKENFYNEGRVKYFYAETKTYHTTHPDGLEVLEFPDGQVEKRYKDGSSEIKLPNGSIRYFDPKNEHVREEWRFPDGSFLTVSANGEQRIVFANGQVEVHAKDHKRREFPDGSVKLVYNDGTAETRYASGRVRIKDKHGNLIMDSAPG